MGNSTAITTKPTTTPNTMMMIGSARFDHRCIDPWANSQEFVAIRSIQSGRLPPTSPIRTIATMSSGNEPSLSRLCEKRYPFLTSSAKKEIRPFLGSSGADISSA